MKDTESVCVSHHIQYVTMLFIVHRVSQDFVLHETTRENSEKNKGVYRMTARLVECCKFFHIEK